MRTLAAPLLLDEAGRLGGRPRLGDEEAASVLVALSNGLVRQRRLDPDSVADNLFARACNLVPESLRK